MVDKNESSTRLSGMSLFSFQWMPQSWTRAAVEWLASDRKITMTGREQGMEHGGYLENPGAEKGRMVAVADAAVVQYSPGESPRR